jgi:Beta-lactamase superfamily domain
MEFLSKNGQIIIDSNKKELILSKESITIDGLVIDVAGEYEKSGCLAYMWVKNDEKLYHFRMEGYWIAYIPSILTDISPEALDFLGTVDVLVMPTAKIAQGVIEKVEPRLLVTYGETAHEIGTLLGYTDLPLSKYKLKDADLSAEKTNCVVLG